MRRILMTALANALALGALAAPARADNPYPGVTHLFDFGGAGAGAGQLGGSGSIPGPAGIAVNNTSGDVYVAEPGNNRISQFDADGNFIRAWGEDVVASGPDDTGTGPEICDVAAHPTDVCKAGAAGFDPGGFKKPSGIAVDNSSGPAAGSVYVQDTNNLRIQRFSAGGQFVLTWGKGVNATSGGDVCPRPGNPGDTCGAGADSSEPSGFNGSGRGSWLGQGSDPEEVAVDGAGRVYVASGGLDQSAGTNIFPGDQRLVRFDSSGAVLDYVHETVPGAGLIGQGGLVFTSDGLEDVAVSAGGDAYVSANVAVTASLGLARIAADQFSPSGVVASSPPVFPVLGSVDRYAVDPADGFLFALGYSPESPCKVSDDAGAHIVELSSNVQALDCTPPSAPGLSGAINGLAVSASHRLYMSATTGGATPTANIRVFAAPQPAAPAVGAQSVDPLSHSATVRAPVTANLAETQVSVQYGTAGPCSVPASACDSTDPEDAGASRAAETQSLQLSGLAPDTTYHYRVAATNSQGTVYGSDRLFHTFPAQVFDPSCPNNLARQQTGAAFLLDCRAYELVSAPDAGGYDVESSIVSGQTPFGGYPGASGKALYAIHDGGVPGVEGKPTNRGPDPYLASRDAQNQRWDTTYVGIPADAPSTAPFSSTLLSADAGLGDFAFGPAASICAPCFGDGSVGIPIHRPDGSLVQGMAGSLPVALPVSAGVVKAPFSADGSHFVFGSKQQFEPPANSNNTDATIYSRDLETNTTEVVSTDQSGAAIQNGTGLAELGVSSDGSRTLIGKLISTDAAGNPLYRLYLHLAGAPDSYLLTPGATSGVLFAGMTSDGSKVFFTSAAQITSDDHDSSADLYETDVDPYGAVSIHRVSVGESGTGDTDSCNPLGNSFSFHWNALPGDPADCSVTAIGGAGGVASGSGSVYFLSPERLDTSDPQNLPVQDAPNLYLARPGSGPQFVATLESERNGPQPPLKVYISTHNLSPAFTRVSGLAVDRPGGYLYAFDFSAAAKVVKKFDLAGHPVNFTAGQGNGTNALNGSDAPTGAFLPSALSPSGLAVDQASGKLYVPDFSHNVVDVFNANGSYASQLAVTSPSAVAINPTTHDVYVTTKATTGKVTVFPSGGGPSTNFTVITNPSGVAVDSTGKVYVVNGAQTALYASGAFVKVFDPNASVGVTVDPTNDDVFVDEKSQLVQFDSTGAPTGGSDGAGAPIGAGSLSNSLPVAIDAAGNLYASNNNTAIGVFPVSLTPNRLIDSPLVIHALSEAGTRHTADFQTTPSGDHAAFPSLLPLSGFDSASHYEVFRYDAQSGQLDCASCNPTLAQPAGDASLPQNGLGIDDQGQVFFNTAEPLVLRDVNKVGDAYEWDGRAELISSGTDSTDSSLLSVTQDGADAFFFTRETLAAGDNNGNHVKLYDARANGGFFHVPSPPPCVASDECHGPGSEAAPRPPIGTNAGSGGNVPSTQAPKPCRKGKVRHHGRCVSRHPHNQHKRGGRR